MWSWSISTYPSQKQLNSEFKRQHLLKEETQADILSIDLFRELLTKVMPYLTMAILITNDLI